MTKRLRDVDSDLVVRWEPPGSWARRASCSGLADDLHDFFGKSRANWALSKRVCRGCPVRRECLTYALATRAVDGVWGMLAPLELRFALGLDASGAGWTYTRAEVKCPYCRGATETVRIGDELVQRKCEACGFGWERYERDKPKRKRRAAA